MNRWRILADSGTRKTEFVHPHGRNDSRGNLSSRQVGFITFRVDNDYSFFKNSRCPMFHLPCMFHRCGRIYASWIRRVSAHRLYWRTFDHVVYSIVYWLRHITFAASLVQKSEALTRQCASLASPLTDSHWCNIFFLYLWLSIVIVFTFLLSLLQLHSYRLVFVFLLSGFDDPYTNNQ